MINKWLFEVAFAVGEMKRDLAKADVQKRSAECQARQNEVEYAVLLSKAERQERSDEGGTTDDIRSA